MEPDMTESFDRGEDVSLMEPMRIPDGDRCKGPLLDKTMELAQQSTGLRRSLPPRLANSLADLVRAMNCYYSNLIEGHNTHPVDIERALRKDFSADTRTRDLQLEARAHVAVQGWIDEGGLGDKPFAESSIRTIHRQFCEQLPDDLLWVDDDRTGERLRVKPGELRRRDVVVGSHIPVSPGALPRFLQRFEQVYGGCGKTETVFAAAAAHHRLLWIHPFLDGNGRVARLLSHAVLRETLDTGAIWSVSRGLARNVQDYKRHLAACDAPRKDDTDGRGSRSLAALIAFTDFFLDVCLDQIAFMEGLIQPETLRTRIQQWVEEGVRLKKLPPNSATVLDALLYRGELARGEIPSLLGVGERQARRIVSALMDEGVVTSDSSRAPLTLAFPARLASRWMPGLFPEKVG